MKIVILTVIYYDTGYRKKIYNMLDKDECNQKRSNNANNKPSALMIESKMVHNE